MKTVKEILAEKLSLDDAKEFRKEMEKEANEYFPKYVKMMTSSLNGFKKGKDEWGNPTWTRSSWGMNDFIEISLSDIGATYYHHQDEMEYVLAGEVTYGYMGKSYRFGARGVDIGIYEKANDLKKLITPKQLLKWVETEVAKKQKSLKGSVEVRIGGSTFTFQPKAIEDWAKDLKRGKTVHVSPRGMGTGYEISTKRFKGRFGTGDVDPKTAQIFGFEKLYFQTFDAD